MTGVNFGSDVGIVWLGGLPQENPETLFLPGCEILIETVLQVPFYLGPNTPFPILEVLLLGEVSSAPLIFPWKPNLFRGMLEVDKSFFTSMLPKFLL